MAGIDAVPVHWWTKNWWGTLPAAYRAADAAQEAPGLLYQVGFNAEPLFIKGLDGWTVSPVEQGADAVTLRFTRVFAGIDLTLPVVFQVWWTADAPGAAVSLNLVDGVGRDLGTHDYEDLPLGDGDDTLIGVLAADEPITATLTFTAPIGDGGLLFNIRGVNVGNRAVSFEALPGNLVDAHYPLLRYMEGIGQIAGQIRDISDGMWGGEYLGPSNTPDAALRWVAQMMGVSATIRNQPTADLRAYLVDLAVNGRPASGTRRDISNAARAFLTGAKQTVMVTHPTRQHSLVMLVREEELPGADVDATAALAALVAGVRSTGVVPAGHELTAQIVAPTWDDWEAAAGVTWDDRENAARTWTEADSLGVTITE
ncbi:hypothetical protein Jinkies_34 [Arthrobacter phage Jinkies]|uniref:Uncharacterized protein n=1 Tax=Arthrobacter phage Jinkies TaxID=2743903 RepID=A0A7S6BFQ5_9CAUD|nr:hypothetical protein Jinkies_34 [Arthrobacter phage Jinkies]